MEKEGKEEGKGGRGRRRKVKKNWWCSWQENALQICRLSCGGIERNLPRSKKYLVVLGL